MRRITKHWKGLLASGVVVIALLAVGVPWVYIHFVEGKQPAPLSLSSAASGSAATSATVSAAGSWTVGSGSQAGYRVHETLAGQGTTAVGRTTAVTGKMTITGTEVTAATVTVDMTKVASDKTQRDSQFQGRIMDTATYPTATFTTTEPITLGSIPAAGKAVTASATGKLTLHGTTKAVTIKISAVRTRATISVSGTIPVTFGDYNIANPSFGSFVKVGNSGQIEFLVTMGKG